MKASRLVCYFIACCVCNGSGTSLVYVPQTCYGSNEVFTDCVSACGRPRALTCDQLRASPVCDPAQSAVCQTGCVCTQDHYRDGDGECVPREYCDKCNQETEVYGCYQRCDKTCAPSDEQCVVKSCAEQCYCRQGYARGERGVCVKYEKCSQAAECPENEEFGCHRTCPPKRCIAQFALFRCIPPSRTNCAVKCDCKEGFLRDGEGVCIKADDCTPADGGVPL